MILRRFSNFAHVAIQGTYRFVGQGHPVLGKDLASPKIRLVAFLLEETEFRKCGDRDIPALL
jgi:hypothetical protein